MTDITVRIKEDVIQLIRNNHAFLTIERKAYEEHDDIRRLLQVFLLDLIGAEIRKHWKAKNQPSSVRRG